MNNKNEQSFWRAAAVMYWKGLHASFFVKRAAEIFYRRYEVLTGFEATARAPVRTPQSIDCPGTLPSRFCGELLELIRSTCNGENEMRAK